MSLEAAAFSQVAELKSLRVGIVTVEAAALELDLRRFEVFASDTLLVENRGAGDVPIERPKLALFRGEVVGEPGTQAVLGVSPLGTSGVIQRADRLLIISSGPSGSAQPLRVLDASRLTDEAIRLRPLTCGADQLPAVAPEPADPQRGGQNDDAPAPCRRIRVAIDTDWEFTGSLFGGNTAAASAYAALLIGSVSEIFRTEFNAQLEISYLRVWSSPADPWTETNAYAQLDQFEAYWNSNMAGVSRHVAHLLSGRGFGDIGGVAWLRAVCQPVHSYGLSAYLNGYFPYPATNNNPQNWDLVVVAHELGHNLGAPHTHDMSPPIDGCGLGDCGQAAAGTIMSYCHTCPGGLANIRLSMQNRIINEQILPYLEQAPCDLAAAQIGDADGDGTVAQDDLDLALFHYGQGVPAWTSGDVTGDGRVDQNDLDEILFNYGRSCCVVPVSPGTLQVASVTCNCVALAWQDRAGNELAYRIARLDPGEDPNIHEHWDNVGETPANQTSFVACGLQSSAQYWFKVRARGACGYSAYSNIAAATTTPCCIPPDPTSVWSPGQGSTWIALAWSPVPGATHYRVAKLDPGEDPGNPAHWDNVGGDLGGTSYTVTGLLPNGCYLFRVKACVGCGCSDGRVVGPICAPCPIPAAASTPWTANLWPTAADVSFAHNQQNVTEFGVARLDPGEDPGNPAAWDRQCTILPGQPLNCRDDNLCPGRTYFFRVRAHNECGQADSPLLAVTPPLPAAPYDCNAVRQGSPTPNPEPIRVTWSYSGPHVSGFRVARIGPFDADGGCPAYPPGNAAWQNVGGDLPATAREYTDNSPGRVNGKYYYYIVRAYVDSTCGRDYGAYSNCEVGRP